MKGKANEEHTNNENLALNTKAIEDLTEQVRRLTDKNEELTIATNDLKLQIMELKLKIIPIEKVVYGIVGLILVAVFTAIITGALKP